MPPLVPQNYDVEMYEILHSIMSRLNRSGYVPLEPGQYEKAVAAGYVKGKSPHRTKFTQAGYDTYADLKRENRNWEIAEGDAQDAQAEAEFDARGDNPVATHYAENAGAKLRFPVHSYFSAQTAYHDAHRGRKRGAIANNTFITEGDNGEYCIVLHRTRIVCYRPDGSIVLNSGGYQTTTTKARMNEALPRDVGIYQKKGEWYVSHGDETIPFHDGIVIHTGRTASGFGPFETNAPRRKSSKYLGSDPYIRMERRYRMGDTLYRIQHIGPGDLFQIVADGEPISRPAPWLKTVNNFLAYPMAVPGDAWVDTWEERDRLIITLYKGTEGDPNNSIEVLTWTDDGARQMFEDGFFKPGRLLEASVVEYAEEMGLI